MAHRHREWYVEKKVQCIIDPSEVHDLLGDLCVKLGFCIPPEAQQQLEANPPAEIDAFVRAVYIAEGMNPELAEQELYRQVREVVTAAFERAARKRAVNLGYHIFVMASGPRFITAS